MTMTAAPHSIDPATYLDDLLEPASPDLLRQMLQGFINQILSAQADTVCGAEYGVASTERVNHRNGYRYRDLDTRLGTSDVAVPKLRHGAFFPDWLLERRLRAERALSTVIATCYLKRVSTRRMNDLVATLGIANMSKSHVSHMSEKLDEMVTNFKTAHSIPVGTPTCRVTRARSKSAKAAGWSNASCCLPTESTPTATAKCSACMSPLRNPTHRGKASSRT